LTTTSTIATFVPAEASQKKQNMIFRPDTFILSTRSIKPPEKMKRLPVILSALLFATLLKAQPPDVPAEPGATFGEKITAANAQPVAALPALLEGREALPIRVEGKVTDVCPKKGCWVKLELPNQQSVFVRMKDYGFFVPVAIKGHTVVIDGTAKTVVTSVDDLKHYAEDAKKSQAEIDAIKEPKREIQLMANGILVVK
jgi:hypothetical protein